MNDKDSTSEKRTNPSVKSYPFSTLAKTRKLTMELRERIELGIRSKERREKKRPEKQSVSEHTLSHVTSQWLELKKHSEAGNYAVDIWHSFERHIFPIFQNKHYCCFN